MWSGGRIMSVRTEELRKTIVRKDLQTRKEKGKRHEMRWGFGGKSVGICLERARFLTESYKQTEGEPEVIRRAKGLKHILENMTLFIRGRELIVGNFASNPARLPFMPELATEWLEQRVKVEWHDLLDEEGHREFDEIIDYWRPRCIDAHVKAVLPDYLKPWIVYRDNGGVVSSDEYQVDRAFPALNYEKVLHSGLEGIKQEAEDQLALLQREGGMDGLDVDDWLGRVHFLKAAVISCEGAITFARRFAELAQEMGEEEHDPERKRELLKIAENCKQVPRFPAKNFHQAVQCFWLVYLIAYLIETTRHGIGVRIDQILYPFYKKDREEEGVITREEAQELIECLLVKIEETGQIVTRSFHATGSGTSLYQTFTIGGVDKYGNDASNEVSSILIDAALSMQTCQTNIALRYHPRISHQLVLKAIELMRTGIGYPDLFNDSMIVPTLRERGVPLEVARTYTIPACVQLTLPGKNTQNRIVNGCFLSVAKCLELALNQGKPMNNGRQIGYPTPDPSSFRSVDDVMAAYLKQVNFAVDKVVKINNIAQHVYAQYGQLPFTSVLLDGCIEKGKDCTEWTEYSYSHIIAPGFVNVSDSLAAMQKLVFEDKTITMDELLSALKNNFEGYEVLRQKLLNAPKFGNDDDYADDFMRDVVHKTQDEVKSFNNLWGYPWTLDGSVAGGYYATGTATWALPDGKREGRMEACADGTISPAAGRDKNGPTAVIKSMGKVDPPVTQTGNQKFMPQFLEGNNREKFAAYIKTWADLGGWHIQFNTVDRDTLVQAQKHPEQYSDLIIRVAGYSAYFVDIPKGLQDDIIARTPQSF